MVSPRVSGRLSVVARAADGVAKIVLKSTKDMLLKLALKMARHDSETREERQRQGIDLAATARKYSGRKPNRTLQQNIIALHNAGHFVRHTADLMRCRESQVKQI